MTMSVTELKIYWINNSEHMQEGIMENIIKQTDIVK